MRPVHRGYTLLEVTIAGALFFLAVAAVLESAAAARRLQALASANDAIELEARAVLRAIADDLTMSGWDFVDTQVAGVSRAQDRQLRYYPMAQIQPAVASADGFNTRLPWTRIDGSVARPPLAQVVAAFGADGAERALPGDPAHATQAPLDDEAWRTSFHARSCELVFLRSTVGTWQRRRDTGLEESMFRTMSAGSYLAQLPSSRPLPLLNFSIDANGFETTADDWRQPNQHARLQVLFASGFEETPDGWEERTPGEPYGATLDGGWYDPGDVETAPIKPLWESMRKADIAEIPPTVPGATSPVDRYRAYMLAPERRREYMYAVVRSPVPLGTGRLVRACRRPDAGAIPLGVEVGQRISEVAVDSGRIANESVGMVVDRVLSDHIVRVVFDTYRTVDAGAPRVTTLAVNQVRVRLYFVRPLVTDPRTLVSRVVETTVSMRARSSGNDIENLLATLGTVPIGIAR